MRIDYLLGNIIYLIFYIFQSISNFYLFVKHYEKLLWKQAMIDGMQAFVSLVPITAEAVVGKSWAEK